jgi:hypothetical protein
MAKVEMVTSGPGYTETQKVVLSQPIDVSKGWGLSHTEQVRKVGDEYVLLESKYFLGLNVASREIPFSKQHDARPRRKLTEIGKMQTRRYTVASAA